MSIPGAPPIRLVLSLMMGQSKLLSPISLQTRITYHMMRLDTLPFVENGGRVVYVNAFSVNNIFKSKVGRERMNVKPGDFPHHSN